MNGDFMNEFTNNLINIDFGDSLKPLADLTASTLEPLSDTLQSIFLFVFQKPIAYKIVKETQLESLAKLTREKYGLLDQEKVTFENVERIGKILEDSIYQLSNECFREYYSSLMISTLDSSKNVKPFYSSMIREFSVNEVKLLNILFRKNFIFTVKVSKMLLTYDNFPIQYPKNFFDCLLLDDNELNYEKVTEGYLDISLEDVLDSLYILLSFNLIESEEADTSLTDDVLENNKKLSGLKKEKQNLGFPSSDYLIGKRYKLTSLGESLKSILSVF